MWDWRQTCALFGGLALGVWLTESKTLAFFTCLWFFPERMIGVMALSWYLLIFLPSYASLSFDLHVLFLTVYMLLPLPEVRGFRRWSGWDWVRRVLYPVQYANEQTLEQDEVAVYAISPHGVYAENVHLGMVLTSKFADVVPVGSSVMSWISIAKDFCAICGVIPAEKRAMMHALVERKKSILLVPDGIRGILYEKKPYLVPERTGFVRCAVEAGATIVPVHMHNVWSMYKKVKDQIAHYKD